MTDQELFDTVARHLLTQRKKSQKVGCGMRRCAYRGNGGLKCAIGCLIPDERYDPDLEGIGASSPRILAAAGIDNAWLAVRLQNLHDGHHPNAWRRRLREAAAEFGLDASVLSEPRA